MEAAKYTADPIGTLHSSFRQNLLTRTCEDINNLNILIRETIDLSKAIKNPISSANDDVC